MFSIFQEINQVLNSTEIVRENQINEKKNKFNLRVLSQNLPPIQACSKLIGLRGGVNPPLLEAN